MIYLYSFKITDDLNKEIKFYENPEVVPGFRVIYRLIIFWGLLTRTRKGLI